MRFKTQQERDRKRQREPVWCDCCQDAPATTTQLTCNTCGHIELGPTEWMHTWYGPQGERWTCIECQLDAEIAAET